MHFSRRAFVWGAGANTVAASWPALAFGADGDELDLGVASGDPAADAVTLWTRVPQGNRSGEIRYEVATSPDFAESSVVVRGDAGCDAARDYCVKVRIVGLEPATTYYYRFHNDAGYESVAGRTRTAPAPGSTPAAWRVAFVSCQQFSQGYFAAYGHLVAEDVDVVVHLGDHIYEGESGRVRRSDLLGAGAARTLADYRKRWRGYLSDPQYREARRCFAFVDLWDDHEVFNNYAGPAARAGDPARLSAAYQAFCEYLPVPAECGVDAEGKPVAQVYRSLPFGDLAEMFVLDERQYRSDKACPSDWMTPGCSARLGGERSMLGGAQKAWLKEGLAGSRATWKLLLNEVMLSPMRVSARHAALLFEGVWAEERRSGWFLALDSWDGFPAERAELAGFLRDEGVRNVVVFTGDIHAALNARIPLDIEANGGPGVALEIVTTSISSTTAEERLGVFGGAAAAQIRRANPQYAWSDLSHHGYTVAEFSAERMRVRHIAVDSVTAPTTEARVVRELVVPVGTINESF